jgi:hypothetical protein
MAIAEPLLVERNKIRFRSLVNRRVFSLVFYKDGFELVELNGNDRKAMPVRILYTGVDEFEVQGIILQEVCDVR